MKWEPPSAVTALSISTVTGSQELGPPGQPMIGTLWESSRTPIAPSRAISTPLPRQSQRYDVQQEFGSCPHAGIGNPINPLLLYRMKKQRGNFPPRCG